MGRVTDLDFEKYCKVGQSPNTVLPPPRARSKVESRSRTEKANLRKDPLSIEPGFKEIKYRNYRSHSCKSLPSRNVDAVDSKVLLRGSVYQSSQEIRARRPRTGEERKKIEFSLGSDAPFSFSLLDSICGSDEEGEEPSEMNTCIKETSASKVVCSVDFPRAPTSLDLDARETSCSSAKPPERDLMENLKFKSHQVTGPTNTANVLEEMDNQAFKKSLSAKLALPHSPIRSDNDCSGGIPKSRFSPFIKMFEPLTKSKSHRTLSKSKSVSNETKSSIPESIGRNKTFQRSSLHDFSSAAAPSYVESDGCQSTKRDQEHIAVPCPCSPAHLQGNLKVEEKHGVPYFQLSLCHTEDVYLAKIWKAEDALSWVYTFHSIQGRKKSSAGGHEGLRYSNKDSPIVGQMQVSCHLCSEIKDMGRAFSNSLVTECVLYDILHARQSVASEQSIISDVVEIPSCSTECSDVSTIGSEGTLNSVKVQAQETTNLFHRDSGLDFLSPYPWAPADLHPGLETAAVVIKVPFEKRESLKYRAGETIGRQVHFNLLDRSLAEQTQKGITDSIKTTRVNVVTSMGNHSLPASTSDGRGPSPLLDRWRLGGGCDCGGWDMGCPLIVFSNQTSGSREEHSIFENEQPCELFLLGAKEKTPALSISYSGKGQYTIKFHAQLSALQAFAICVAILHTTTEASTSLDQEKYEQLFQCNTMKVLVEDEVKMLIETVTEEEEMKEKVTEGTERGHQHSSYVLNPPFSPIARV